MCGIVAAVAASGDVRGAVLAGLKTLEYRGYDSAGMAVLADGGLHVRRKLGKIANLEAELSDNDLKRVVLLNQAKEDYQRRYINEVLARNNGNRTKTAQDLGVDPRTIFRHLEREGGEAEE